jgi:hypothetical protein
VHAKSPPASNLPVGVGLGEQNVVVDYRDVVGADGWTVRYGGEKDQTRPMLAGQRYSPARNPVGACIPGAKPVGLGAGEIDLVVGSRGGRHEGEGDESPEQGPEQGGQSESSGGMSACSKLGRMAGQAGTVHVAAHSAEQESEYPLLRYLQGL